MSFTKNSYTFAFAVRVAVAGLSLLQPGCASLLKGTSEQIMVSSEPPGANVSVNGQQEGTTPYVANVPSSRDLQIELSKPGYEPLTVADNTSFRWGYEIWSFVDFVIPMGVDMADGAAWGHDQTMVAAHLNPVAESQSALWADWSKNRVGIGGSKRKFRVKTAFARFRRFSSRESRAITQSLR